MKRRKLRRIPESDVAKSDFLESDTTAGVERYIQLSRILLSGIQESDLAGEFREVA